MNLQLSHDLEECVIQQLCSRDLPVIVYGAGYCAENSVNTLRSFGKDVDAICVDDKYFKPDKSICGMQTEPLGKVLANSKMYDILVAFGSDVPNWDNLRDLKVYGKIFGNVGFARGPCITKTFIEENWENLCECYGQLADELSRQSFIDYLNSRTFGHTQKLPRFTVPADQFCDTSIPLSENERYCDCGAFDGDTIRTFVRRVEKYEKIYAWEPDRLNMQALKKYVQENGVRDTHLIEKCVGATTSEIRFSSSGTSVSTASEFGVDTVQMDTVDNLARDSTLIKVDVEGGEFDVLKGAEMTIRANKPKVIIAIYHRREDVFKIQKLLYDFNNRYYFFFRWHRHAPDDVMLYAI